MSASSEKKAERGDKRRQEEQNDRRSVVLYTVIGVLVLAAALVLMVWKSGLLQRNLTALDVNGAKYTAADLQYYYSSIYNSYASSYYFDPSVSVKRQTTGLESGQSWYDFLVDQAVETLTTNTALAAKANAEGFTLTEESQAQLDSFLAQLNTGWIGQYPNQASFIKANFGPYMTYDRLTELAQQEYLASDYAAAHVEAIDHSDADYEAYYQEHAGELDTIVYTQFNFRASVPATDAEGNPVELTDEEKAAQLETLKTEQKALAEEVKAKLEGGATPEEIAEEYEDQLYSSAISRRSTGANAAASSYGEWLLDSARKAGDITLAENDTGSSVNYYVAVFEERLRDEENSHSVRHILLRAGSGNETPTQEQYDEAEQKAQDILDQWKAGEATEDSFAALSSTSSEDTGSKSGGGLIDQITSNSPYMEPFRDWAVDPARQEGDTGLVKTDYGWHVMYYSSTDDPIWRLTVTDGLAQEDYDKLITDSTEGWSVTRSSGLGLIEA